jgi:ABC-type transporter lipoprotein component MlaA
VEDVAGNKEGYEKTWVEVSRESDAFVLTFGEYMVDPDEHIMLPLIGSLTIKRSYLNYIKLASPATIFGCRCKLLEAS